MRYSRIMILIFVGWYLLLVLGHYFNQRPLWNDEQRVLDNIILFKHGSLFERPLLGYQAFPRLYLYFIQQFSKSFNQNLLALRLFSLLAMIGAFFVWINIARRFLSNSWDMAFFISAWAGSTPLVYYAAELKPYSMDVLASGIIVLFLIETCARHKFFYFLLPLLGLWSYPAIFLLLLPLYNLVRACFMERRWLPELSFYLGGCLLMLSLAYTFDFRVSVHHLLEVFWHDYFISLHSWKEFLGTFGKGMNNLIARRFAESPRWVKVPSRIFIGLGVGYMLLAFWNTFKKDHFRLRSIVPITFAMFMAQLVLAMVRVYPFAVPRMSLFFTPPLLLMTVMAMRSIGERNKALGILFQMAFAGYLIFVSLGITWDIFIKGDLGAESTLYSTQ